VAKAVALFELSIGPLLLWSRTRRYAIVAAYAFHAGLEIMAHPDLLGWGMMTLLLCFVADIGDQPWQLRFGREARDGQPQ
jgi:hypothetical protein